ncbi:hypothetical protein ACFV5J_14875 [Streptomyces zaomyceticus]|uniref:hypothetical protein n=1 Tax=Streptomyces zaomyceticus TaxID=68286 RepID=UPI001676B976|nr:hypothetical protein [Streptomyces zaomyceticus]GHG20874.1 hypothetical protein GCM10018791_39930 [Streptomyces zaomyceticus]
MGFDEDWAGIRSGTTAEASVGMRLNQLDGGGGGGPSGGAPHLATAPAKKKAAANTIETELEPDTAKAAKVADAATTAAVGGFEGWATAAGLKTVETTWDSQVKGLLARLSSEKTALRGTAVAFGQQELDTRARIAGVRPTSSIERY